ALGRGKGRGDMTRPSPWPCCTRLYPVGWQTEIPRSHFSKRRTRRRRSRWHGKIRSPALYPDPRRTWQSRSSVRNESGRGKCFRGDGHLGVVALFCQHFPSDLGQASGGDGDGFIGPFAAGAVPFVERTKVVGA